MIALIANVPADQTLSSGLIFGRLLMGAIGFGLCLALRGLGCQLSRSQGEFEQLEIG